MKTYHVHAAGDDIYFCALNQADAEAQLTALCGPIPSSLLIWKEIDALPDGEEYAADVR
jgi:hypothetical protein